MRTKVQNPTLNKIKGLNGDAYLITNLILEDIKFFSNQIFALWYRLVEVLTISPKFITEYLRAIYEEKMREHWGENIFRTRKIIFEFG